MTTEKWLDSRQIKTLLRNIEHIASDKLKEELKDHLETKRNEGAYICNLVSDESHKELRRLDETYHIIPISIG